MRICVLNEIYSIGDNATRCRALIALRSLRPKAKIYLFATPFVAKIFARSMFFDEFVETNELKQSLAHSTNLQGWGSLTKPNLSHFNLDILLLMGKVGLKVPQVQLPILRQRTIGAFSLRGFF